MARPNPLSIEVLALPITTNLPSDIDRLIKKVIDADRAREEWGEEQRKLTRQRYSVRTKQRTTPWKGASNLNVPLLDKTIRKWKPGIIRLQYEADPVAHFGAMGPEDLEAAQKAELFYDWLFKTYMDSLDQSLYLADLVAHRGTGYLEVSWDYRTERRARVVRTSSLFPQGLPPAMDINGQPILREDGRPMNDIAAILQVVVTQYGLSLDLPSHRAAAENAAQIIDSGVEQFKLVYREAVCDKPAVVALDPIQVITPPRETDIKNADYICIQNLVTRDDLRRMAEDGILERGATLAVIRQIEDRVGKDSTGDAIASNFGLISPGRVREDDRDTVDELTGILQNYEDPENIEVWKIFCWLDINGDGERERAIVWYHPGTKTVLATLEYVLPFARWPIQEFVFERTHSKRVLSSRGISKMLSPLQTEINRLHNNRLDAQAIQLAPVFLVRSAGNTPRNLRWAPGTAFPVQETTDIMPLQQDLRNLGQFLQEEQFVRLIAEEYIGVLDSAIGSQTNIGGRRTATEIEAVQAQVSGVFSLDASLWQHGWREVHRMVFALWRELGEAQVVVRVVGDPEPMIINKNEIDKDFDISPSGTPTSTNKAIELSRAREVLQLLWNPFTLQTGAINPLPLLRWYLGSHDRRRARQIVAQSDQEMTAQQTIMAAAAQIAQAQAGGENLSELFSGANQVPGQYAGANSR